MAWRGIDWVPNLRADGFAALGPRLPWMRAWSGDRNQIGDLVFYSSRRRDTACQTDCTTGTSWSSWWSFCPGGTCRIRAVGRFWWLSSIAIPTRQRSMTFSEFNRGSSQGWLPTFLTGWSRTGWSEGGYTVASSSLFVSPLLFPSLLLLMLCLTMMGISSHKGAPSDDTIYLGNPYLRAPISVSSGWHEVLGGHSNYGGIDWYLISHSDRMGSIFTKDWPRNHPIWADPSHMNHQCESHMIPSHMLFIRNLRLPHRIWLQETIQEVGIGLFTIIYGGSLVFFV